MNAQSKTMTVMHSNGKHNALISQNKIKIEFIAASLIYPQIKPMMKSSTTYQNTSIIPGLFQIAAQYESPNGITSNIPVSAIMKGASISKALTNSKRKTMKSTTTESPKSQSQKQPVQACGWTFTIRK